MLHRAADRGDSPAGILNHLALGFIQFAERLLGGGHLPRPAFFSTDKAIVLRTFETDTHRMFRGERLRHLATQIDCDRRIATRTGIVKVAAEPAGALDSVRIAGSLPNLGRAEMRTIGIRIAYALNDG